MEGDWEFQHLYYHFYISIHSLRMEGDLSGRDRCSGQEYISIHSLRMEGDFVKLDGEKILLAISIHSLRMEGDGNI